MTKLPEFKIGERVVYPSHGVGEIINIENQKIAVYPLASPFVT